MSDMAYRQVLKILAEGSSQADPLLRILDSELSLPNIPMPTMGGTVFWNDIVEYGGWRLQQNMITHHARILTSDDTRIAWGTINGMKRAMDRMVASLHQYDEDPEEGFNNRQRAIAELKSLKELLDIGAITEAEYQEKKSRLMSQI